MKDDNNALKDENKQVNKNYLLLVDEYNKLRKNNEQNEQKIYELQKENGGIKNQQTTTNKDSESDTKLKEEKEKLMQENDDLQNENKNLREELKRNRGLQKIVDALRMNRKEQAKNYQIEGSTLDYLRPRDFEDDKIKNDNSYMRAKRPPKNYVFKKNNKRDDTKEGNKSKGALAIMKIMQAHEQKRKSED